MLPGLLRYRLEPRDLEWCYKGQPRPKASLKIEVVGDEVSE